LAAYGRLPLRFEKNVGQAKNGVRFLTHGRGYSFGIAATGARLALRGTNGKRAALHLNLQGSNPEARVSGEHQLPGSVNYLRGNDRSTWKTGVPIYQQVRCAEVYPGIDLLYHGANNEAGAKALEYDFVVRPGAQPDKIRLQFAGAQSARVDEAGTLRLALPGGEVMQPRPVAYQTSAEGTRRQVRAEYRLVAARTGLDPSIAFELGDYDPQRPVVIDPVLAYSTYLGGEAEDEGVALAVDAQGAAYVVGNTASSDFPQQSAFSGDQPAGDAFITKLRPTGSGIVYSTYLGGENNDNAQDVAVSKTGEAYIAGDTNSPDFPTHKQIMAHQGSRDGFLARLNAAGNDLVSSTCLGGPDFDVIYSVALGKGGIYLTGAFRSTNLPLKKKIMGDQPGQDAVVIKLKPNAKTLVYSTYLGGAGEDFGLAIAVDKSGSAFVVGSTDSANFPRKGALGALGGHQTDYDVFVAKLSPGGNQLKFSGYLGGNGADNGYGIALDKKGSPVITGRTFSTNFPLLNPILADQPLADGFVTRLNKNTGKLIYSTYLGGTGFDSGQDVAIDSQGDAYVTGFSGSNNFPQLNGLPGQGGNSTTQVFATRLKPAGALVFSTLLGGTDEDRGSGISVNSKREIFLTGYTDSTNFPHPNEFQEDQPGRDGFVAKIVP
jgi:hypothetical protein